MGVKDFFKIKITNPKSSFLGKPLGAVGEEIRLGSLKGSRVCIDASWAIYSSILAMARVDALTDAEGNTTAHINTIFNQVLQLHGFGIEQIWIFDSPEPNEMKKIELQKRADRRRQAAARGNAKVQFKMTGKHVQDIKDLLTALGVMHIEAPPGVEAEQYGAALTKGIEDERYCKYMISRDSDILLFEGNLLYKSSQKTASGKSKKTVYKIFELDTVLDELAVTYDQLLEMAAALGCDFCTKTRLVGPKTVVKKVKDKSIIFTPEQLKAIEYFKSKVDLDGADIQESKYDRKALLDLLVAKGFNKTRLEGRLNKVFGSP